ncbi:unnamed protein product [Ectocarpus sp. 13 AM-2016]
MDVRIYGHSLLCSKFVRPDEESNFRRYGCADFSSTTSCLPPCGYLVQPRVSRRDTSVVTKRLRSATQFRNGVRTKNSDPAHVPFACALTVSHGDCSTDGATEHMTSSLFLKGTMDIGNRMQSTSLSLSCEKKVFGFCNQIKRPSIHILSFRQR